MHYSTKCVYSTILKELIDWLFSIVRVAGDKGYKMEKKLKALAVSVMHRLPFICSSWKRQSPERGVENKNKSHGNSVVLNKESNKGAKDFGIRKNVLLQPLHIQKKLHENHGKVILKELEGVFDKVRQEAIPINRNNVTVNMVKLPDSSNMCSPIEFRFYWRASEYAVCWADRDASKTGMCNTRFMGRYFSLSLPVRQVSESLARWQRPPGWNLCERRQVATLWKHVQRYRPDSFIHSFKRHATGSSVHFSGVYCSSISTAFLA